MGAQDERQLLQTRALCAPVVLDSEQSRPMATTTRQKESALSLVGL
jgi:hypothetical protein